MASDLDGCPPGWTEGDAIDRAVWAYLESIERGKPKARRGRKRTPDSIVTRLRIVESELADATSVKRLRLMQEQRDLVAELDAFEPVVPEPDYEADFIGAAKVYGERRGITYAAWREVGVPAQLLKSAGIVRSG